MSIANLTMETIDVFPTYSLNRRTDVTAGCLVIDAAMALLGKGGAVGTILLLFAASAISSVFTIPSRKDTSI